MVQAHLVGKAKRAGPPAELNSNLFHKVPKFGKLPISVNEAHFDTLWLYMPYKQGAQFASILIMLAETDHIVNKADLNFSFHFIIGPKIVQIGEF